jgi:hypothetical protein
MPFFFHLGPVIGVRRVGFKPRDTGPDPRKLGIDCYEIFLAIRHVFFGIDSIDGTFGDTDRAVDTLIGVDHQEVGTFAKTVYGADVHAVCIAAFNTGFGNNMGHGNASLQRDNEGSGE